LVESHTLPSSRLVVAKTVLHAAQRPFTRFAARHEFLHPHLDVEGEFVLDVLLWVLTEQSTNISAVHHGITFR
jgi:hypothetical protein